jgi:lipid-binding SYLF domain-containing protein
MPIIRRALLALGLLAAFVPAMAMAEKAEVIESRVDLALERLYREIPGTRDLVARSEGVLVMPAVTKGGFIVGASYGEGALRLVQDGVLGPTVQYYSIGAASVGLQAGIQESAHALFFLTTAALERFRRSDGWEAGVDAEITVLDRGASLGVDSTKTQRPVVAIVFGQSGVMVGASLEGAKYSRIDR